MKQRFIKIAEAQFYKLVKKHRALKRYCKKLEASNKAYEKQIEEYEKTVNTMMDSWDI